MKKLIFSSSLILALSACSDSVIEENESLSQAPQEVRSTDSFDSFVDLSEIEMANCYIVTSPGTYRFKADNQFNIGEGLPEPPVINPVSAALVWQSEPGSISDIELISMEDIPYINFQVNSARGNALIAALDSEGEIVWSWHIWMPEEKINGIKSETGYEIMNMNLGALNNNPGDPNSYGMLYQWGRKDPFPAAPTLTGTTATVSAPLYDIDGNTVKIGYSSWTDNSNNTLEYAISHPVVCLSNMSQYSVSRDWLVEGNDALWGFPTEQKTCYDPSPAGWRVAPSDAFSNLTSTGGYAWDFADFNIFDSNHDGEINLDDYNYGWHFLVASNSPLYFPAAARFDGSYAMLMGSMSGLWGSYWSNSPYAGINGGGFCCLSFQVKNQTGEDMITVSPSAGASKADAFSIRCVRDIPKQSGSNGIKNIIPD